jgi:hypothetical protein
MYITVYEVIGVLAAVIAILMLGSRNVRFQLSMYTLVSVRPTRPVVRKNSFPEKFSSMAI